MKDNTNNQLANRQGFLGGYFVAQKSMVDERVINDSFCAGCGTMLDWSNEDTVDYVDWIDGKPYCLDCSDGMQEEGEEE